MFEDIKEVNGKIVYNQWIEWEHIEVPNKSKGKKSIFESLGFSSKDSKKLKFEMEKQSLNNYLLGNYLLKNLDNNGQRLAIPITLSKKAFYTGWILEPEGKIRNTTPFGGWVK